MPKGKIEKVIGSLKDELWEKIMIEFVPLRLKANSYLMDDGNSDKEEKGTKKICNNMITKAA